MMDQSGSQGQLQCMGQWANGVYYMYPNWQQYWKDYYQLLEKLGDNPPPKTTSEDVQCYNNCLKELAVCVNDYIWTGQTVLYHLFQWYRQNLNIQNPRGFELFQKQKAYLHLKSQNYDFSTKKKGLPVQQSKRTTEKKEQQEVVIRKEDPQIDLPLLSSTEWNRANYPKYEDLRKPNVNIVFIGHVDSGKSTLSGRILVNLKVVDETEYKKLEQEAKALHREGWELAFVTSNIQQEKDKGKTIECSKTVFALPNRRFTLFDAPGHANYVPNMIMGACQADMALLIVSSKQGEFESGFEKEGQTKQHALLARALGVTTVIVAITKMGLNNWSHERYQYITNSVVPYLKNVCKYDQVICLPLDSIDDKNIDIRNTKDVCSWYDGPCVLELLNTIELAPKNPMGPLRIPIVDKMKDQGQLYVYGKVQSGTLLQEQTVTLLPTKKQFVVKEIFDPNDTRIPYAPAGENVKMKVKMIQEDDIQRGNIICNNQNYCQKCVEFRARLYVVDLPDTKKLLSQGSQAVIHLHASVQAIEIESVEAIEIPETKKMVKATFLKANQTGIVKIKAQNDLCLEKFDFMPQLGRFTLRDQGKTIAYGEILKFKASQTLTVEQKTQLVKGDPKPDQTKEPQSEKVQTAQ